MKDIIAKAASCILLDDACRPIQEELRQTDGGITDLFFSDENERAWNSSGHADRVRRLEKYVAFEVSYRVALAGPPCPTT